MSGLQHLTLNYLLCGWRITLPSSCLGPCMEQEHFYSFGDIEKLSKWSIKLSNWATTQVRWGNVVCTITDIFYKAQAILHAKILNFQHTNSHNFPQNILGRKKRRSIKFIYEASIAFQKLGKNKITKLCTNFIHEQR